MCFSLLEHESLRGCLRDKFSGIGSHGSLSLSSVLVRSRCVVLHAVSFLPRATSWSWLLVYRLGPEGTSSICLERTEGRENCFFIEEECLFLLENFVAFWLVIEVR